MPLVTVFFASCSNTMFGCFCFLLFVIYFSSDGAELHKSVLQLNAKPNPLSDLRPMA
jgi:predicted PurR-regulated permease PerM